MDSRLSEMFQEKSTTWFFLGSSQNTGTFTIIIGIHSFGFCYFLHSEAETTAAIFPIF